MKYAMLFIALTGLLFGSCRKDNSISPGVADDYVIFGSYFGECVGEGCIQMYKVTDTEVQEEIDDKYWLSGGAQPGSFVALAPSKFEIVKNIANEIPADLYTEASVIGIPDGGDWGGLYLEVRKNGETHKWNIDMMKSNVPEKYHTFIDLLTGYVGQMH